MRTVSKCLITFVLVFIFFEGINMGLSMTNQPSDFAVLIGSMTVFLAFVLPVWVFKRLVWK